MVDFTFGEKYSLRDVLDEGFSLCGYYVGLRPDDNRHIFLSVTSRNMLRVFESAATCGYYEGKPLSPPIKVVPGGGLSGLELELAKSYVVRFNKQSRLRINQKQVNFTR